MKKYLNLLYILFAGFTISNLLGCEKGDKRLSVMVVWGGDELESFKAMIKPFEESTGIKITIEATRDINAVLTTRLEAGNPPDLANLPNPGVLKEFAQRKRIIPIDKFIDMNRLQNEFGNSWIELGSHNGRLYGIFVKTSVKSLVWFCPPRFFSAGYKIPKTWKEMMKLTERIMHEGKTPWSIGFESGAASGWPGTDWIEDILLRTAGTDIYDRWVNHEIPWTHPSVRQAWQLFGDIVLDDKFLYGGKNGALATNFGDAVSPLFTNPPGAYMHRQATFIQSFIQSQFPDLKPVEDFAFFPFPIIDPENGNPLIVAADLFVVFKDSKPARMLIEYLSTAKAQEIWVRHGGSIAPNKMVKLESYPDELSKKAGRILTGASAFRFDGSDLMPASVNNAFCKGVLDYVRGKNLDDILLNIEKIAVEAYGR